ncbi:MAG: NAD(P)H:quinone oxidoreductase, type [Gemmatimonadetes bacterium]|nr:NAD(P)H:quinone oxidoreductase, type [Gemmatimonadota bacterium]
MPKILVLFYSRSGNTAALADAIADGARSVRFSEVEVRRIDDLAPAAMIDANPAWKENRATLASTYQTLGSPQELADYDALILGSPTRFGVMTAELKSVLDQVGGLWKHGALVNKVGAAFTLASTPHGGHETTLWSIMTPMANLGMILVPPGYTDPVMYRAGSPYGATATVNSGHALDEADLAAARHQGKRVAEVTGWITHAKSHTHGGHQH